MLPVGNMVSPGHNMPVARAGGGEGEKRAKKEEKTVNKTSSEASNYILEGTCSPSRYRADGDSLPNWLCGGAPGAKGRLRPDNATRAPRSTACPAATRRRPEPLDPVTRRNGQ